MNKAIKQILLNSLSDGTVNSLNQSAILVFGDSNHVATGLAAGPATAANILWEWNGTSLVELTTADVSTANLGSQWKDFANIFNAATNRKLIITTSALGGTSFEADGTGDDWSSDGGLYVPMVTKANNCLNSNGLKKFIGIFISLGINDIRGATALATIQTAMASLFDRLGTDFPGTPIFLTTPGRSEAQPVTDLRRFTVKRYLVEFSRSYPNVYLASNGFNFTAWNQMNADGLHYSNAALAKNADQAVRCKLSTEPNKEVRQAQSYFYDTLSDAHKLAYKTFIEGCQADGNWNLLDQCTILRASSDQNSLVDLLGVGCFLKRNSPIFKANDCVQTDGSINHYQTGYNPALCQWNSSPQDVIIGFKTGTNLTPAGTVGVAIGVVVGADTLRIFQTVGSQVAYAVNSSTLSVYSGDTKLLDETRYAISRDVTTQYFHKNGSVAHSQAATFSAAPNAQLAMGATNNSGTFSTYINCEFYYFFVAKKTGFDLSAFETRLETLLASLI